MEVSNLESIPGKTIVRHLGLVQGSTVRAKHAGRDILAGLKNIVGGELKAYTELLVESRKEAVARMTQQLLSLAEMPRPADATDALAVAYACAEQRFAVRTAP